MKYRIEQDTNAESPRGIDDHDCFIVAKHPQFHVPAPGERHIPEHAKELVDRYAKTHWVFPIEAYIHSGVRLAFSQEGQFPDRRWDVSQVGYVFVSKRDWRLSKSAKLRAKGCIETWNQYLGGDVWGYVIEDDDGKRLASCWGFYGKAYAEEQAKEAMASCAA